MKLIITIILWCILWSLCWPFALALAILLPFLWLLSIPFRIFGVCLKAVIAFLVALLMLPARLIGHHYTRT